MTLARPLAALAVATTLVLAGCGDKDSDDAAKAGAPVEETTTSATPAPTETTSEPTTGTDGLSVGDQVDVDAFLDDAIEGMKAISTAHFEMTMTGQLPMTGEGDIDTGGDEVAARMTMRAQGVVLEMRIVDGYVYTKTGGSWTRQSLAEFSKLAGVDFLSTLDPVAYLEAYRKGVTAVEYLGRESVDGEQASHYALTVQTADVEMLSALPGLPATLRTEIWVDDQHRTLKTQGTVLGMTTTMTQSDFGEPVTITAPPAGQVS